MSDVKVYYEDKGGPAAFAGKLLSAAKDIGEDASVVVFGTDGYFTVPAEVADKAGVDYEHDASEAEDVPVDAQGADESDDDASDDLEVQGGDDEPADDDNDAPDEKPEVEVVVPEKGEDGYLAGKGLEEALKERELPSVGTADEKRYAVAAYDANKE